jgi:hypothetical protein
MRKTSLSIKILTGLAVVVVALGVTYAVMLARATARLRQAYADLQKDGRPMQAADVIPPEVPDIQNSAVLYESAALLLRAQPSPEVNRPADERDRPGVKDDLLGYVGSLAQTFVGGTLDPNQQAELQQLMTREVVTSAVATVEQGTQRPVCRFDNNYDNGMSMMHPNLADLRSLTSIVGARARLEAQAGRPQAAWELVQTQVKLADGMRAEPLLISQMVRLGLLGLSSRTIQALAGTTMPNDQQYERLMGLLDTLDDVHPLVAAIDGERLLMGEWLFTLPKAQLHKELRQFLPSDYWPQSLQRLRLLRMTFKPFFLNDHAALLQYMREYAQFFEQPYSVERRDSLEKKWSEALRRHVLTGYLAPALSRIREIHCRAAADIRVTRTGLALLHYRDSHGGFPATLDALGLRDVSDPFTGKPLLYRVEDKGFVLYSVGEDLKDNGGTPRSHQRGKQPADYDIVWRFPAPQGG